MNIFQLVHAVGVLHPDSYVYTTTPQMKADVGVFITIPNLGSFRLSCNHIKEVERSGKLKDSELAQNLKARLLRVCHNPHVEVRSE